MRKIVITTALVALTIGVAAQPASRPPPFRDELWSMIRDGLASTSPDAFSGAEGAGQSLATSGREELVTTPAFAVRKVCQPLMRDGKAADPVAYIAERAAAAAKVTMINEAHDQPLTRAFIAKVAAALRPKGYTAYGAETFAREIAGKAEPLPLLADGYYSKESIYGRLVRDLRGLDYRLFPYEAVPPTPGTPPMEWARQREIEQAANMAAQVKRESGKLLVHVGHGHLTETATATQVPQMGALFKQNTGIDPFTVDTTTRDSGSDQFIVCDPAFEVSPPSVDIRIGMPKLTYERGRPAWRRAAGDHFIEIPAALRRPDQVAIYEARVADEPATTTPMDRLLLRPGESLPLLLPPGRYGVSVWTEREGWSDAVSLTAAPGQCAPIPYSAIVRTSQELPKPVLADLQRRFNFRGTGMSCNLSTLLGGPHHHCFRGAAHIEDEWLVVMMVTGHPPDPAYRRLYKLSGEGVRDLEWRNASRCTQEAATGTSFGQWMLRAEGRPAEMRMTVAPSP